MKKFFTPVFVVTIFIIGYNASGQNVGIGQAAPLNKLDIKGNLSIGNTYSGAFAAPANGAIIEGLVGIGTSSPAQQLHVGGNANTIRIDGLSSTGTYAGTGVKIVYVTSNGDLTTIPAASAPASAWLLAGNAGTIAGTNFIGTTDAVDFVVKTTGTERMRVLSGGNVGIGTVNPAYLLQVQGGVNATVNYLLSLWSFTASSPGTGTGIKFTNTNGGNANLGSAEIIAIRNIAGGSGDLAFKTATGTPTMYERQRIQGTNGYSAFYSGTTLTGGFAPSANMHLLADLNTELAIGSYGNPGINNLIGQISGRVDVAGAGNSIKIGYINFETESGWPGSFSLTDAPGRISFWTVPDNSGVGLERMRITNAGQVFYNHTAAVSASNLVESQANAAGFIHAIAGYTPAAAGRGIFGQNTAGGSSNFSIGVYGLTSTGTSVAPTLGGSGVFGVNTSATGYGIIGVGNNSGILYLQNGAGGLFNGNSVGAYGIPTVAPVAGTTSVGLYGYNNTSSSAGAALPIGVEAVTFDAYGDGMEGFNVAGAGAGFGDGIYGQTSQTNGLGIEGYNSNTSGTGVAGAGNGLPTVILVSGSGGSFNGTAVGSVSYGSTAASGVGVLAAGNGLPAVTLIGGAGAGGSFNGTTYGLTAFGGASGYGIIGTGNSAGTIFTGSGAGGDFTGTNFGAAGYATTAAGYGIYGVNNAAGVGSTGTGVYGFTNQSAGYGVIGINNQAAGYAIYATNNSGAAGAGLLVNGYSNHYGSVGLGRASNNTGALIYYNATNANTLTINSGVTTASYSLTLPTAQGAANSFLMNSGAGVLAWNTGTGNFILNQVAQQAASNFNISGNGTIGTNLFVTGQEAINQAAVPNANLQLAVNGGAYADNMVAPIPMFADPNNGIAFSNTSSSDIAGVEAPLEPGIYRTDGYVQVKLIVYFTTTAATNNFQLHLYNTGSNYTPITCNGCGTTWTYTNVNGNTVATSDWVDFNQGTGACEAILNAWVNSGTCTIKNAYVMVRPKNN